MRIKCLLMVKKVIFYRYISFELFHCCLCSFPESVYHVLFLYAFSFMCDVRRLGLLLLNIDVACAYEMSVSFYQATQCHSP
jgi:hypothetical protein